jgi:hypothetical protein
MVGVMIGAFIRRTLAAMALTLVLLLLIQAGISTGYPYLLPPSSQLDYYNKIQQQHLVGTFGGYSQDLIMAVKYVSPDGKVVDNVNCMGLTGPYITAGGSVQEVKEVKQCLNHYHVTPFVEYQRFDERFWPLQFVTTALLLVLTILVTVLTYWQLRRRML